MKTRPHKFLQGITTGNIGLIDPEDYDQPVMDALDTLSMTSCLISVADHLKETACDFPREAADILISMDDAIEMKNIAYASGYAAAVQQVQRDIASAMTARRAS